jgi:steroid delta-isomerase-like uncharacterized protein
MEDRVMERQDIESILSQLLEAWRHRDAAALAARHSQDGVFESMLMGPIEGRGNIESLYRNWFLAFPDMDFTVEDQVIEGDQAAIFWSQRGRHVGEFCGLTATGRLFHVRGAFYYAFENGEIARTRSVYDITALMIQIGVLKAKPGF